LLVNTLTLVPCCNNFSVNFLPTNPVAPEMATVVKGASRSFFVLLLVFVVVVVVALVVSVFFSSSAFAADFADDDVRRIRLIRCVPDDDEDDDEEEDAQKRPCFKVVFLLARRIVGVENDAPLLDIIIIIVVCKSLLSLVYAHEKWRCVSSEFPFECSRKKHRHRTTREEEARGLLPLSRKDDDEEDRARLCLFRLLFARRML